MQQHIYLLRHGKVAGNAALYGVTDVAVLPEVNNAICSALAEIKIKFDHIYSSPLQRCKKLAQLIYQEANIKNSPENSIENVNELTIVEDLKEMNFGMFDGVAFDDIYQDKTKWQLLENFWQAPSLHTLPQAESLTDFYQRIAAAWQSIFHTIERQQPLSAALDPETHTLIVCHGGVIRMILANILKENINESGWYQGYNIPYGSLTHLTLNNNKISVNSIAKPCGYFATELTQAHMIKDDENE